jgi:hypothetical protein
MQPWTGILVVSLMREADVGCAHLTVRSCVQGQINALITKITAVLAQRPDVVLVLVDILVHVTPLLPLLLPPTLGTHMYPPLPPLLLPLLLPLLHRQPLPPTLGTPMPPLLPPLLPALLHAHGFLAQPARMMYWGA